MRKPLKWARSDRHRYLHMPPLCTQFALLTLGQRLCEVAIWPSADTYVQKYVCKNLSPGIPCYRLNGVYLELVHYTHMHAYTHTQTHTAGSFEDYLLLHLTTSA